MSALSLLGDGLGAVALVVGLPVAIVLVGLPVVLVVRLILEVAGRF